MRGDTLARMGARRHRRRWLAFAAGVLAVEAAAVKRRSGRLGGNVVVRCRRGHLFTTIWVPGASVKAVRLGFWRLQRCPVGGHWSVVTPVHADALNEDERRSAGAVHDLRVP